LRDRAIGRHRATIPGRQCIGDNDERDQRANQKYFCVGCGKLFLGLIGRYNEPFGRTRPFAPTLTSRVVRFLQRKFVVMLAAYSTPNLARLLLVTRWVHLIGAMLFYSEETSKIAGGNYVRIFRLNAHV
jgi:hypothetical protein